MKIKASARPALIVRDGALCMCCGVSWTTAATEAATSKAEARGGTSRSNRLAPLEAVRASQE